MQLVEFAQHSVTAHAAVTVTILNEILKRNADTSVEHRPQDYGAVGQIRT